jgi:drug/metabolite transporter (DMT)-like permease
VILPLSSVIWGSTYIITKTITQDVSIFLYLGIRHLIALIGFAPFLIRLKKVNKTAVCGALITGGAYFLAMMFQTFGLMTTTAGKAGFITGLYAIFVPFLSLLVFKTRIKKKLWISVGLAVLGMLFLSLEGEMGLVIGDLLVLFCAFFAAMMIVLTDKFVKEVDIYIFSILEMILLVVLCFSLSFIFDPPFNFGMIPEFFWIAMIYVGLIATTVTFIIQNWGQRFLGATESGLIFSLEPIFATIFGTLFGNEMLTIQFLIGAGLILTAIVIAVFNMNKKEEQKKIKKD